MKTKWPQLCAWIFSFEAVSALIGYLTQGQVDGWYKDLQKPAFTPPNFLFPVAWTVIYALVAVAGVRIYNLPQEKARNRLLTLFAIYMAMNWAWSFIFFTLHMLLAAFAWILMMDALILILIVRLQKADGTASWLLMPLLLWTLFATYLAGMHWNLNG